MVEPPIEKASSALTDQLIQSLVRTHIQQLPTSALEAILNLTAQCGALQLVELVVQEHRQRHLPLLR